MSDEANEVLQGLLGTKERNRTGVRHQLLRTAPPGHLYKVLLMPKGSLACEPVAQALEEQLLRQDRCVAKTRLSTGSHARCASAQLPPA